MPGFFQHLAPGGGERAFLSVELALREHPVAFAKPHDRDQRFRTAAHHDAACRQNGRRARHALLSLAVRSRSASSEAYMERAERARHI